MDYVGQPEQATQHRIVQLFQQELGYTHLGDWQDRPNNSCIEEKLLHNYLKDKYSSGIITKALHELKVAAKVINGDLYNTNKRVYALLRYGVKVKVSLSENTQTVHLIDWKNPHNNHFAIAEEVTVIDARNKRPDIVLYINGLAIGVLELKRTFVSLEEGIRQSITNQNPEYIQPFFSTVQLIWAGNDTQGLRYGTVGTSEKFYLNWKEDIEENSRLKIDKYLLKMCQKERLIELMYDFVLFDGGIKKLPRVHQYFGVKAAQKHIQRREGGIIWHTQGSGKSITMVLLAKWILENQSNGRVVILTDRDELDKQIESVFIDAGEKIYRTKSGTDLLGNLEKATPRLICSLIHKFGKKDVDNFERFIKDLESQPSKVVGEIFVFIDECHRTQSGKLHRTMKAILPNAVFIGFTGTPLLKKDKKTSLEVFGKYIHTYKFNEAVKDGIVKDLVYEARDIDQRLGSQQRVDEWFAAKTKGLNEFQTAELKKKWGTMQKVLSSRSRMDKIVADIIFDFSTKPRLNGTRGNAILVAKNILNACSYYKLFQETSLKGKCAVVTSYNPSTKDITKEDTGANTETDKAFIYKIYTQILENVQKKPNKSKTEVYEDAVKMKFKDEPANMRLLIVVDKLLTGFDAPSCSYIYIDKRMQDHGLFQAICRVNRLDTDDKLFGHIIDYEDLFESVQGAVNIYTSEIDYDGFNKEDCQILLQDRLTKGKERLDNALEQITLLCEPVPNTRQPLDYQHYFCGNTEIPEDLKKTEPQRSALYKNTVALVRAYANIAEDLDAAGYSVKEQRHIKKEVDFYLNLREEIRQASGEKIDLKSYEADMRHLIDHYIQADESKVISNFGDLTLLEIIEKAGMEEAIGSLPKGIKNSNQAVAETIENNVRQKIIRDHMIDPAFFEKMSHLLQQIIHERKTKAITYEAYLKNIADLARKINEGVSDKVPVVLDTPAKRALYNNLGQDEALAIACDKAINYRKKADWRGNRPREKEIQRAIYEVLKTKIDDEKVLYQEVQRIFAIVVEQQEY